MHKRDRKAWEDLRSTGRRRERRRLMVALLGECLLLAISFVLPLRARWERRESERESRGEGKRGTVQGWARAQCNKPDS